MAFGLGSATYVGFGETKGSMSVDQIRSQRQRMFELTDALGGPVRKGLDPTPSHVG